LNCRSPRPYHGPVDRIVNTALRVHSLDRALNLLEALQSGPRSVSELSADVGLPRTTVFRLLSDLELRGYVQRRTPGWFTLSLKVLELAGAVLDQLEVREASQDVLAEVASRTGRTAHLAIRDGVHAICVARVESPNPLRLSVPIGRRTPLYAGAASRVLLAYAPEDLREQVASGPLNKLARHTATTRRELLARLARIRADGYAITFSEAYEGVHGVAAPIRDGHDQVVAAISLGGVQPASDREERRLVDTTVAAAARISARLGRLRTRAESATAEVPRNDRHGRNGRVARSTTVDHMDRIVSERSK
jgi:IclR family KDG regulon transcriptional repressor